MVLQIEATLNAETFFPGDNLYCRITFSSKRKEDVGSMRVSPRNIQTPTKQKTSVVETLQALSIYVAGYYAVEPSWVKLNPKTKNELSVSEEMDPQKTVGVNGRGIFVSPPTDVNTTEWKLNPDESKSYMYHCILPYHLPPSLKETGIKYRYFVGLTITRNNQPPVYLSVSFRVLNPSSSLKVTKILPKLQHDYHTYCREIDIHDESFPDSKQPLAKLSLQDSLAESDFTKQRKTVVKLIEENRYPVTANISKESDLLVKFSVNKSVFTLGDVIKGTFDFSQGTIPCYQLSVRLQTEQTIEPSVSNPSRGKKAIYQTVAEHHELTKNTVNTSFSFYIPIEASQELATEIVAVKWVLQFEFITGSYTRPGEPSATVEPLHWTLPLRVLVGTLPPNPIYKSKNISIL